MLNYTKVMYGQNAVHIPAWMVLQNQQESGILIAGASRSPDPLYGTEKAHVFILGEIIIRPHFVVASDDFKGRGAGGFWTDLPSANEWMQNGELIVATERGTEEFWKWR